jgi:H+/Cl- antiporter ClcA
MDAPTLFSNTRLHLNKVQASSKRMFPYWISAAATAVVAVLFAKAFGWSEKQAFAWCENNPLWGFLFIPLGMLVSSSLAQFIAPFASGSGIPQLLAAVEISREPTPLLTKLLSARMIVIKFVGSCVCVAGGGITGREGPMLQIAAGIFNITHRIWHRKDTDVRSPDLQPMILAGGAAGLAAAFNTPLGGIIFAIEELAKVHISYIRTFVFHAVIMAGLLAQAMLGNYHYIGKFGLTTPGIGEMSLMIVAAALIGILGAFFGSATVFLLDRRAKLSPFAKVLMTIGLGWCVATFVYFFGKNAMGSGRDVIVQLLSHSDASAPMYLGFVRGVGNLLTYAGGVVGGVFAPALSTGAAIGSWMSGLSDGFNHQLWVLAGMAAFLTGVTRTPFTSLILVLEMTDTHDVIICLMLAAIVAQSVAKLVDPVSFYEHMCHRIVHGKAPAQDHAGAHES